MMLLALTVALLAGPQDDPAVLYREGLYEEIDQGNLEKAMDVYGRLLKGNAEPGLKARAFYRRGACLEKSGKKAEAEQVFRDVQERFPEQAEIVKQARGRLAALSGNARGAAFSPEAEIQQLILDLGLLQAADPSKSPREKAIHRLTLIGETAVPELKRALGHKDQALACGAARVLVELDHPEGTYEVFLKSMSDSFDTKSFANLLSRNDDARKRFRGDSDRVRPHMLRHILEVVRPPLQDPQLSKSIEDRMQTIQDVSGDGFSALAQAWWYASEPARLSALLRRFFRDSEKPQFGKIQALLNLRPSSDNFDTPPELAEQLREGLKRQDIGRFDGWIRVLLSYVPTKDLIHVLLASWLKGEDVEKAKAAAQMIADNNFAPLLPGVTDFACDALMSKDYRDEVKVVLSMALRAWAGADVEQEPRKSRLQHYYLEYLRRFAPKGPVQSGIAVQARDYLIRLLSAEDDGWDMICDLDMIQNTNQTGGWTMLDNRVKGSERLRSIYVQAAARALQHELPEVRQRGTRQLTRYITAPEERALATLLPKLSKDVVPSIAREVMAGYLSLSVEERKAQIKELAPLFKSPNVQLRQDVIWNFKTFYDGSVDAPMKEALEDSEPKIRRIALEFWVNRGSPEAVPVMIGALRDPDDQIKIMAVGALGRSPTLDSVPPLLEFLRSSNSELRGAAQTALKAIQQYFDEQDQWRKWYEDMKKRAPKDK